MTRVRRLVASAATAALAVPLSLAATAAGAAVPTETPPPLGDGVVVPVAPASGLGRPDGAPDRIAPALQEAEGIVTAFVQLDRKSVV